jgi:fluoride exporter
MWTTLALAGAGALGVLARHAVQRLVPRAGPMPWGTLIVNVSGALAAGLLLTLVVRRYSAPLWVQETLFVGFLGGYTTFSALSAETFLLMETKQYAVAAAYSLGSLLAGLVAVYAGTALGRWLT